MSTHVVSAFLTTVPFLMGDDNTWHHGDSHPVFMAQPSQTLKGLSDEDVETEIETLWQDFLKVRDQVERVILYLDLPGTKELLTRLEGAGYAPRDLIFVLCDCSIGEKTKMLHDHGFSKSMKHRSPCGIDLFEEMFYQHVHSGMLMAS